MLEPAFARTDMAVRLEPSGDPTIDQLLQIYECLVDETWMVRRGGLVIDVAGEIAHPGDWLVRRNGVVSVMIAERFEQIRRDIPPGRIFQ